MSAPSGVSTPSYARKLSATHAPCAMQFSPPDLRFLRKVESFPKLGVAPRLASCNVFHVATKKAAAEPATTSR
nr:MAG TPA: hypothetical protein [Caudoviricetes sp.]